jgi:hypothetical protein
MTDAARMLREPKQAATRTISQARIVELPKRRSLVNPLMACAATPRHGVRAARVPHESNRPRREAKQTLAARVPVGRNKPRREAR